MFSSISVVIINFYGLYSPANIWGGFHFPFYSHSLPICISFFIALFLAFRGGKVFPFKGGNFFFFFGHFTQHMGSQFPDQGSNWCPLHQKIDFLKNNLSDLCIFDCVGSLGYAAFLSLQQVGATPWLWCVGFFLTVVASLVAEHRLQVCGLSSCSSWLQRTGSIIVRTGLVALRPIGSNQCLLHWQAGALSLSHEGSSFPTPFPTPHGGRWILNHWTPREVPNYTF